MHWLSDDVCKMLGQVSIEIGTLAILNGPGVNVPSVRVTALSACKCMVKKSSERKQKVGISFILLPPSRKDRSFSLQILSHKDYSSSL